MGDVGDYWRESRDEQDRLNRLREYCPACFEKEHREAPRLLPGQKCPTCGYKRARKKNRNGA